MRRPNSERNSAPSAFTGPRVSKAMGTNTWLQATMHIWQSCEQQPAQLQNLPRLLSATSMMQHIPDISIAPFQVHYYLEALLTQHGYCVGVSRRSATGNPRVKDLPKVLAWRPERDSNPRPFERKATNLPMSHHAPRYIVL